MAWRKLITDNIADILRFTAYIFLAFDVILLSGFVFWFIARLLWRFAQYIDYHIFETPWY